MGRIGLDLIRSRMSSDGMVYYLMKLRMSWNGLIIRLRMKWDGLIIRLRMSWDGLICNELRRIG